MKKILATFVLLAATGSVGAAQVTYQFSGTTSYGPIPINGNAIPANTPFSGTVTFDDAQTVTPVAFYGGTHSTYAFSDLTLTIGTTTVHEGPGSIDLYDNVNPPNGIPVGDSFYVNFSSPVAPNGAINGIQFNWIMLGFVDGTGTAFSGSALPANLNFTSFQSHFIEFNYGPWGAGNTSQLQPLSSLSKTGSTVTTPPTLTTTSLPSGVIGVAYSAAVTATAPNNDPVTIAIDPASLPAGLVFDGANITGVPSTVGTSSVAVTVTDSVTKLSTSATLPLTINDAVISFTPSLPDAVANSAYSASFQAATGGSGSFSYTASGLPAGLSLAGATIAGTAPAAGAYPLAITATDGAGYSQSANVTLTVVDPQPLACSGNNAVESAWVSATQWVGGTLVNVSRIIIYVNNAPYPLWVANLNSSNTTFLGGLVNWYQTGLILDYAGVDNGQGCELSSLTVKPKVTIDTTALPGATAGLAYTAPVAVSWGVAPYTVTVSGLPAGLGYDGANVSGTPGVVGTFNVTITAVDAVGASVSKVLALSVADQAMSFAPSLPSGTVGVAYSASLSASGFGPFTYSAAGLPAGLSLQGNTVSGIPTAAGSWTITLTATDAAGVSASAVATLAINPAVSSGNYTVPDESQGKITAIGPDYLMVGSKKLVWNANTKITVNTPDGELHVVDGFVKVGMNVQWKGLRDKATNTVLASQLEIN